MDEPGEDFTVIECAYRREYGPEQHDYFVKLAGRWTPVGIEDYDDGIYAEIAARYDAVRVVARP